MSSPRLGLIVRLVISLALIGGLAYSIGSFQILEQLKSVRWQVLAAVVAILSCSVLLVTPRWCVILAALGHPVRTIDLIGSVYLGLLCNQVFPTAVGGDVIRAWNARQHGVPLAIAIHSVLLDRIAGIFIVLVGTLVLIPVSGPLVANTNVWGAVAALGAGTLGAFCLWVFARLAPFSQPLPRRLQQIVANFSASIMLLVRRQTALAAVLLLSAAGQVVAAVALSLLASELSFGLGPIDILAVTFGAMLAAAIPISVAGWGIREGALIFLFGIYGVPPQAAFAISILFGACLVVASVPGALVLLSGSAKIIGDVEQV